MLDISHRLGLEPALKTGTLEANSSHVKFTKLRVMGEAFHYNTIVPTLHRRKPRLLTLKGLTVT